MNEQSGPHTKTYEPAGNRFALFAHGAAIADIAILIARERASSMIKYDDMFEQKDLPMPGIERLTITLPAEMAAVVKSAVESGDYASTSEVVRSALRDWKLKRALQLEELHSLKADIATGLADIAAGRLKDFDADRIIKRGRNLLADRSPSV